MEYQRVYAKMWDDENVRQLSWMAKLVWVYLIVNPRNNFIGFYILKPISGADDLGMKATDFTGCLSEILKLNLAVYDEENRVILLRNFLKFNPVGGEKSMKGVEKALQKLPRTKLLYDFQDLLQQPQIREEGRNEEIIGVVTHFLGTMNLDGMKTPPPERCEKKEAIPIIPVDDLVEIWNHVCAPILPQVLSITSRRLSTIKARLKEHPDLEEWKAIFQRVISSPFLRGENDKGWRADFDWALNPNNLAKILEGKYDDRKNPNKVPTGMDALKALSEESLPRNQLGEDDDQRGIHQGNGPPDEIF
jgi:hypothetical protein